MEGSLMGGGITARTLDYLWLLLEASAWALISAVVTEICAKFEQRWLARFWAVSFFGSALVAAYCLEKVL
jgi:hypothetical protein